jgi:hypothetical protein
MGTLKVLMTKSQQKFLPTLSHKQTVDVPNSQVISWLATGTLALW